MKNNLSAQDIFGVSYSLPLKPYAGVDFSKKCFIFPGQGVATPGMGSAELKKFEILQKRFQIADALAEKEGVPAPSLFIEDPVSLSQDDFSLVRSLALFTLSVGLFEVMISFGERPSLVTAHSFGEYAAFVASGILTFEEAFRIVLARERFCPEPDTMGRLIAVGAGAETLRALPELRHVTLANFNSPRQTVLAVPMAQVKAVAAFLKKNKLPAKVLETVPQPYHSPLMNEAAKQMEKFLGTHNFDFRSPRIPLLSSVSGEILDQSNFSVAEARRILSLQLISPVQFISQIQKAAAHGSRHFIEISVNRIAQSWIADTLGSEAFRFSYPKPMQPTVVSVKKESRKDHDSKLVGLLNRVVASVTGYSVSEISLSKNFQEDLGIDSIKKAQIVLNFLESQGEFGGLQDGILMNQIRTLEDVLNWYAAPKKKKEGSSAFHLYQRHWVETPEPVLDFAPLPSRPAWIALDKPSQLAGAWNDKTALIFYGDGSEGFDFSAWLKEVQARYESLKKLPGDFLLGFVTSEKSSVEVLGFEGFLRSLAKELGCDFQVFRFENFVHSRDAVLVEREMRLPRLSEVMWAEGKRFEMNFKTLEEPANRRAYTAVFAIGGSTGVTFELLKFLAKRDLPKITIMGRRPEREVGDNLTELRKLGAEVTYVVGDATRREDLGAALRASPGLDLVIHGGGIEHSALIPHQKDEDVLRQIQIKVETIRHLKRLSREQGFRVVAFGSTAGELGNQGQAIYAYANQTMTAECEKAVDEGLHFSTIAWPAWDNLGMTAKEEIAQQLRLSGASLLSRNVGGELFLKFLDLAGDHRVLCLEGAEGSEVAAAPRMAAVQSLLPSVSHLHFPVLLDRWTLRDLPALHDHLIMKQSLVPVAFVISFLWHLNVLRTGESGKIQNIEALSFMLLHRRDSPYILDHQREGGIERYEIRANRPSLRAQVVKAKPSDFEAPVYRESAPLKKVDMFKQAYATMGKRLHLLEDVRIADDGTAYARLDTSKHSLYPGNASLNRQLVLLEGMFQLSGSDAEARSGRVGVPVSIDSFTVNDAARAGTKFNLMAKCQYSATDSAEADIYAYNEAGEIFLIVKREKLRLFFGDPVV